MNKPEYLSFWPFIESYSKEWTKGGMLRCTKQNARGARWKRALQNAIVSPFKMYKLQCGRPARQKAEQLLSPIFISNSAAFGMSHLTDHAQVVAFIVSF